MGLVNAGSQERKLSEWTPVLFDIERQMYMQCNAMQARGELHWSIDPAGSTGSYLGTAELTLWLTSASQIIRSAEWFAASQTDPIRLAALLMHESDWLSLY